MRRKQRREGTRVPPPRQRDVLRAVMLCGPQHGSWMTLRELSRVTNYAEASISAQLRHLREPEYGGFVVEKRCRDRRAGRVYGERAMWEYRVSRGRRQWKGKSGGSLTAMMLRGAIRADNRIAARRCAFNTDIQSPSVAR
jgi:hypothetical protein